MDDSPLWKVARQQFVRLSRCAVDLHEPAPNGAARNAVDGLRKSLVALERQVAQDRARPLIHTDSAGEPQAFPAARKPRLRERADDLSYAASFLAIVAREDVQ
jgi:hypothetical protein